ncbi:MAG: hypothetical protein WDN75_19390 [Bacteroidota bacterium]
MKALKIPHGKKRVRKTAPIRDHVLSQEITEKLIHFIEHHPPRRFTTTLRRMLLEFLMYDGAIEASYLNDLLYDLDGLFELLEAAQREEV